MGVLLHLSSNCIEELLDWMERFESAYREKGELPAVKDIRKIVTTDVKEATGQKLTPDSKSEMNAYFFDQIRGIMAPTAGNRKSRASMSSQSAEKLFEMATAKGIARNLVIESLQPYYRWRKNAANDFGLYPQVEFLLGRRKRKGKDAGSYAVEGRLQKIFSLPEVSRHLDEGQTAPDYCVVEVVGDLPRNEKQRREKEQEIAKNRTRKERLFERFNAAESDTRSSYRRVLLFDQQRGLCPYSGKELGDPLSSELQIDHVFPQKRGGISVTENLVLTFEDLNREKGNRTPFEAARELASWDPDAMKKAIARMKWGRNKREIFEWDEPGLPDFGNLTRTSQLARQLRAECAHWMGIAGDPDEMQRRIGTPSGYLRGQAMRSWQEKIPRKDRSEPRSSPG